MHLLGVFEDNIRLTIGTTVLNRHDKMASIKELTAVAVSDHEHAEVTINVVLMEPIEMEEVD